MKPSSEDWSTNLYLAPCSSGQQQPVCKGWEAELQGRTPEVILEPLSGCSEAADPRVGT